MGRLLVAAAAVPLGEGLVLQGMEEEGAARGMGVVALPAGGPGKRVSPVGGAEVSALEVVAAGAEAVLTVQQHELVVGAVIEVAGAAVPLADGEMNIGARKGLDIVLVAGTASAVDAPFEGSGIGEGCLLRRGRRGAGGGRGGGEETWVRAPRRCEDRTSSRDS